MIKNITTSLSLLITTPIYYYIMYQVLVRVDASELMFFLFWVYAPVSMLTIVLRDLVMRGAAK